MESCEILRQTIVSIVVVCVKYTYHLVSTNAFYQVRPSLLFPTAFYTTDAIHICTFNSHSLLHLRPDGAYCPTVDVPYFCFRRFNVSTCVELRLRHSMSLYKIKRKETFLLPTDFNQCLCSKSSIHCDNFGGNFEKVDESTFAVSAHGENVSSVSPLFIFFHFLSACSFVCLFFFIFFHFWSRKIWVLVSYCDKTCNTLSQFWNHWNKGMV